MALTQILTTDAVTNTVVNTKIVDPANAAISGLQIAQTAGGTGTAITLTGIELTNGYQKTFVISASNSGVATTINGKPLYKPGGTVAPNLTAGKAATVWYNLAGDCFFIKASAEGTATAGDVLAGKTFSNDDDTGIIGTLALTGDALVSDVVIGKTFYNTDAKTKLTGTYSNIKSIQKITQILPSTPTSGTITISQIDVNNTIIRPIHYPTGNAYTNSFTFKFINGTTIQYNKNTTGTTQEITIEVIEFNNVKSLQRIEVSFLSADLSINSAISSIDVYKSLAFYTMRSAYSSDSAYYSYIYSAKITSNTNVNIARALGGAPAIASIEIIEFN